jgi:hypothetical protein
MHQPNGTALSVIPQSPGLQQLQRELAEWRQNRTGGAAMPAELWAAAVELARQHGLGPTSKALRVDYGALRKRLQSAESPTGPRFVELLTGVADKIDECSLVVQSYRGARLHVEMKQVPAPALASIIREFAEH